jgi:hypothetical protein
VLPKGAYATTVLDNVFAVVDGARSSSSQSDREQQSAPLTEEE